MTDRNLYIIAYDVTNSARLRRMRRLIHAVSASGQKSVAECYMTPRERRELLTRVHEILEYTEDRLLVVPLGPASQVRTLGTARKPELPSLFYMG